MKRYSTDNFLKKMLLMCCILGSVSFEWGAISLQAQPHATFVYDKELVRLGEVLGALHYLHGLCGDEVSDWRGFMEKLISAEAPNEGRRARFIVAFNRSYQDFAENYHQCTPPARAAIDLYKKEGVTLSNALINRYGN